MRTDAVSPVVFRRFLIGLFLLTMILAGPVLRAAEVQIYNTLPERYEWDTLDDGVRMFLDRRYTFGSRRTNQIPEKYRGMQYLRTAKADRKQSGDSFISFGVDRPVTVYVAHKNSIRRKPSWLQDWEDTGDDLVGRSIFKKTFSGGTVVLGGNSPDGRRGTSMYMVFIEPAGTGEPPAPAAVSEPAQNVTPQAPKAPEPVTTPPATVSSPTVEVTPAPESTTPSTGDTGSSAAASGTEAGSPAPEPTTGVGTTPAPAQPDQPVGDPTEAPPAALVPSNYVWDVLTNGALVFVDRDYVFGTNTVNQVPDRYDGLRYLRTAKDDRASTGNALISFTTAVPLTVYVAHLDSITKKPGWLADWVDTGDDLMRRSIYRKDFPAGQVTLGGNTVDGVDQGSMYLVFVEPTSAASQPAASGPTSSPAVNAQNPPPADSIPVAKPDAVVAEAGLPTEVAVLLNDTGLSDGPISLAIVSHPANGSATVTAANTVLITPKEGFSGEDTLTYGVTDNDGDTAVSTVSISVTCAACIAQPTIVLDWMPSLGDVTGYQVYFGASANDTPTKVLDTSATNASLAASDLGVTVGDNVCFRVRAYNTAGASPFSEAVCQVL